MRRLNFEGIAIQLARVLRPNGVIIWNVADDTRDFCQSLTSFKQAIFFVERAGLKLVDTMIYEATGYPRRIRASSRTSPRLSMSS
jgi:hypothetical protein